MAVRGVAFVVFLLPVVISIVFGSVVMGEILKEPERELNMWPFKFSESGTIDVGSGSVKIVSLEDNYSILESINVQVLATGSGFDCGDLYITIYDFYRSFLLQFHKTLCLQFFLKIHHQLAAIDYFLQNIG